MGFLCRLSLDSSILNLGVELRICFNACMAKVEIYSSELCGFCHAARRLLSNKDVDYIEYSVDRRPDVREEMIGRAGGKTSVPQIFIGDRHVGGYDDLAELDMDDELDPLLGAD